MVFDFLRGGGSDHGLDHVAAGAVAMLGEARHSFDLATTALLTATDPVSVADDVRATDDRINAAEQRLRSELVVHVSVHGGTDIGSVLGFTLLLKRIERIGDQAKNILDLAESIVSPFEADERERLLAERTIASTLFADAAALLDDPDLSSADVEAFEARASALSDELQARLAGLLRSDLPAGSAVALAMYLRFVRRVVLDLAGVVRTAGTPLPADVVDDPED